MDLLGLVVFCSSQCCKPENATCMHCFINGIQTNFGRQLSCLARRDHFEDVWHLKGNGFRQMRSTTHTLQ